MLTERGRMRFVTDGESADPAPALQAAFDGKVLRVVGVPRPVSWNGSKPS